MTGLLGSGITRVCRGGSLGGSSAALLKPADGAIGLEGAASGDVGQATFCVGYQQEVDKPQSN